MLSHRRAIALAAAMMVASAITACGDGDPQSAATSTADFRAALADAPRPLREQLYSQPSELLGGGGPAFERTLRKLRGYPVVVNKWASWCGPCRFEFPFFQREAKRIGAEVAFIGVDAEDGKGQARRFLRKYPVPYPSFFDSDGEISRVLKGERSFPVTAFFDRRGELVYTKQGGYASQAALADDIRQYAR
jgi:cytochrome c biogenesis protein CcmG/thiol:disulfide interchange protein DsbE